MRRFTSRLDPTRPISAAWSQCRHHFGTLATSHISDEVRRRFVDFAKGQSVNPYEDYLAVQEQAGAVLKKIIPQPEQEVFRDFGKKGRSLVLLQNSPIIGEKGLPLTPDSSKKSEDKDYVSEYFMLGIAGLIDAKPYRIEGVRDGNVINQIIPTDPKSISGSGSRMAFPLHNEVVHEPLTPDFFLLLCLRGNPLAKTNYCLLDEILPFLPQTVLDELQKPNFLMKSGDKSVFKEAKEFRCPILTKNETKQFEIRFNSAPGRCEGLTDEAKAALNYLTHCITTKIAVHDVALTQGDTLLVNNKRSLHGRTGFEDTSTQEERRWVQRMNLNAKSVTTKESGERY